MLWRQLLPIACPRCFRTPPYVHLLACSPTTRTVICPTRSFHPPLVTRKTLPHNSTPSDASERKDTVEKPNKPQNADPFTSTGKTRSESQGASFTSLPKNGTIEYKAWSYPRKPSNNVDKDNMKKLSGTDTNATNDDQGSTGNFTGGSKKTDNIDAVIPPNTKPTPPPYYYHPLYDHTLQNNSAFPTPLPSSQQHINPSQSSLHVYYPYHLYSQTPPGAPPPLALPTPNYPLPPTLLAPPPHDSRAELLASTKGFLPRLQLRAKLLLMKQIRPWTVDDFMAMFSWLFVANGLYIILGTTSFVSAVLWVINSLQFQEFAARRVGNFLTKQTGLTVTFESAIVPNWKDGKISLRKVALKRGPSTAGATTSFSADESAKDAMVAQSVTEPNIIAGPPAEPNKTDDYMYVDLTVEQIDVTLDVRRWMDGKGILRDANIRGVRGIIDRSHITYDPSAPAWPNRKSQSGDLQLESFVLEDLLLTVCQVENFRPYTISIFNADVPHGLRIQWLLYDLLCAESMVGMFDQCLFSLHTPQKESMTAEEERKLMGSGRTSRLKIDGVPIDHLNAGVEGPLGWITSGTLDISANVLIPPDPREDTMRQIVHEIVDRIDEIVLSSKSVPDEAPDVQISSKNAPSKEETGREGGFFYNVFGEGGESQRFLKKRRRRLRKGWEGVKEELMKGGMRDAGRPAFVMNFDIRLNNFKASIPIGNPDLTYLSSALVRSVVAYMNANRTTLPIAAVIRLDLENFNGAWTIYQCGLADALSEEIGRAVVMMAFNERERNRRLKRVGLWGLQLGTRNLISVWEYVRGHGEFWANVGNSVAKASRLSANAH